MKHVQRGARPHSLNKLVFLSSSHAIELSIKDKKLSWTKDWGKAMGVKVFDRK